MGNMQRVYANPGVPNDNTSCGVGFTRDLYDNLAALGELNRVIEQVGQGLPEAIFINCYRNPTILHLMPECYSLFLSLRSNIEEHQTYYLKESNCVGEIENSPQSSLERSIRVRKFFSIRRHAPNMASIELSTSSSVESSSFRSSA